MHEGMRCRLVLTGAMRQYRHGEPLEAEGEAKKRGPERGKEEMERQLQEWNSLDIQLYKRVEELFDEQIRAARARSATVAALLDDARDGLLPPCTSFPEWQHGHV